MEHIYDILILGGGPAGYTAALYASRAGLDTILIERMSAGGQMALTGDIDNYPGFEKGVNGFALGMKMQQSAERFGKAVVIATGANPRKLGIKGEKELIGKGIHYCAHCDGRFYKDKTVIVVGGGNSAVADALYLSRLAKKVYIVHRRDTLRATKIYMEPLFKAENVEFVWNSTISDFITDNRIVGAKIKNVKTDAITDIACDGIFINIGRKPATEFLANSVQIDKNGYIIADESTITNVPGVYAVGDVRTKVLRQIVTAVADGAVAIHYAEEYLSEA